jgi:tetraprenyl-beta-curcumene synthase
VDSQTIALAVRFLTTVVPKASAELRRLRTRASAIPDASIRREALDSIRHKAFHVHGGCVFATFLPSAEIAGYVSLVASFETAVDYLDNLCDRIGNADEQDFRALHEALIDAVTPGAPLRDYFRNRAADDGGYLAQLVAESQSGFGRLPSFAIVRDGIVDVTQRYCELQALKHLQPDERERRCEAAFASVAPDLRWWEGAAASGSTMATFALAHGATAPGLTESRARDIYAAYFPYFTALHILLDYFVDQAEDRAHGELNFVACYPDAGEAHAGIARIARLALQRVAALEHPEPHVFALRAMCGYYCTRPALSKAARSAALEIMREAGVDVDPHPLLKLYARMART